MVLRCVCLTAGFGNISPHTEGGRIFCIVYALLGIPLFGFLLAGVGDQLGTIFGKGIAKVEKMIVVSDGNRYIKTHTHTHPQAKIPFFTQSLTCTAYCIV